MNSMHDPLMHISNTPISRSFAHISSVTSIPSPSIAQITDSQSHNLFTSIPQVIDASHRLGQLNSSPKWVDTNRIPPIVDHRANTARIEFSNSQCGISATDLAKGASHIQVLLDHISNLQNLLRSTSAFVLPLKEADELFEQYKSSACNWEQIMVKDVQEWTERFGKWHYALRYRAFPPNPNQMRAIGELAIDSVRHMSARRSANHKPKPYRLDSPTPLSMTRLRPNTLGDDHRYEEDPYCQFPDAPSEHPRCQSQARAQSRALGPPLQPHFIDFPITDASENVSHNYSSSLFYEPLAQDDKQTFASPIDNFSPSQVRGDQQDIGTLPPPIQPIQPQGPAPQSTTSLSNRRLQHRKSQGTSNARKH